MKHSLHSRGRKVLDELPMVEGLEYGGCLGHGHFSHVFQGTYLGQPVAIKVIERGSERLIQKEVKILKKLSNTPHIVNLLQVIEEEETLLIFELIQPMSEDDFFDNMNISNLRLVLRNLLEGLAAAHSQNIIHRDIKYENIMVLQNYSDVKIIDWGCGCNLTHDMNTHAGSRSGRSPEMLLEYGNYNSAIDIWAVGIFIIWILRDGDDVPWREENVPKTLVLLSYYFGKNQLLKHAQKYHLQIPNELASAPEKRKKLLHCFDPNTKHLISPELIDLLEKLLTLDPEFRPTAVEALQHPFFTQG